MLECISTAHSQEDKEMELEPGGIREFGSYTCPFRRSRHTRREWKILYTVNGSIHMPVTGRSGDAMVRPSLFPLGMIVMKLTKDSW